MLERTDRVEAVVEEVVEDDQNEYFIWPSKSQLSFLSVYTDDFLNKMSNLETLRRNNNNSLKIGRLALKLPLSTYLTIAIKATSRMINVTPRHALIKEKLYKVVAYKFV